MSEKIFSRLSISQRVYSLMVLAILGMAIIATIVLFGLRNELLAQRKGELMHLGESAVSIVQSYYDRAERGEMTETEAQQAALSAVQAIRYGDGDYFWVNDLNQIVLMHPIKPELVGKDLSGLQDQNGKLLFVEFVKVVNAAGQGFVDYLWPKPGSDEPVEKLSFVTGFAPWGWVLGTGVYIDDLAAIFWARFWTILQMGAVILLTICGASFVIGRSITKPLAAITDCMGQLAAGNLKVQVPGQTRRDEIGKISAAVEVFKTTAVEQERLKQQQAESERRAAEEKRQAMRDLADGFEASVKQVVDAVSAAATEMQATAGSMTSTAERTTERAGAAAQASEEAAGSVQTVAAAAEELSKSIDEISGQVSQSTNIANKATQEAERTNGQVEGLVEAAQKIGDVVKLIQDIAEQTNLLALNATIEAARAGEAGKGFAVVASEVKTLANQTAKATEEISQQIGDIQSATTDAAAAIRSIGEIVSQVNDIAGSIAAAVEEQGAATQDIARSATVASGGTQSVSNNVGDVTTAADETGQSAGQVLEASGELAQQAERLRGEVAQFIEKVRAA